MSARMAADGMLRCRLRESRWRQPQSVFATLPGRHPIGRVCAAVADASGVDDVVDDRRGGTTIASSISALSVLAERETCLRRSSASASFEFDLPASLEDPLRFRAGAIWTCSGLHAEFVSRPPFARHHHFCMIAHARVLCGLALGQQPRCRRPIYAIGADAYRSAAYGRALAPARRARRIDHCARRMAVAAGASRSGAQGIDNLPVDGADRLRRRISLTMRRIA